MRFIFETITLVVFGVVLFVLYTQYWDDVMYSLFGEEQRHTIYLGKSALDVTVADDRAERVQGLSGVATLDDFEGKLFIFDTDDNHGIWMKDMLMPLDIIWIDRNLQVVHIEENVLPSSYPNQIFVPSSPARFVLEVNAYFVSSTKVKLGDRLLLPPSLLPPDIEQSLQE